MTQPQKIAVIIGTRAQFIKTAPVMRALEKRAIPYRFVFAAQHRETIDAIRKDFGVKPPDYVLSGGEAEAKTIRLFGGWAWRALHALLWRRRAILPFRGGIVINHGDTATCLWGTLLARLTGNQSMHLESGLRSFHLFKPFPEELIRLLTFAFTTVYACPNAWAVDNLRRHRGVKLNTRFNTLLDAVRLALSGERASAAANPGSPYAVVSIHRFEHIFKPAVFRSILDHVERIAGAMPLVFVAHPATVQQLDRLGLRCRLDANPSIDVRDRRPFFEFIRLVDAAEFVVTDGGSNQEELFYLGKPTLLLREATERREGLGGNAVLSKLDPDRITEFCANYAAYRRPPVAADASPSEVICDWLVTNGFSAPTAPDDAPRPRRAAPWRVATALAAAVLAVAYIWANRDVLAAHLAGFNPAFAPWLLLTALTSIAVNGAIMRSLVRQFGVRLRAWECFGLTAVGSLCNYLPVPQAGGVVRGVYLKSRHKLPYDTFTATVMVTYVMALPAIGVLGVACLAVLRVKGLPSPWPLWLLFAGLSACVLVFGPAMGLLRPFKKLARFQAGIRILLQRHIIGRLVVLQITQLVLTGVALWLGFRALGHSVGWAGSLMIGLLANAAGVANVTPGNIGVVESATGLGAFLLSGDTHLAVVAYSLYRVASIVVLGVSTTVFLLWTKGNRE